MCQVGSWLAHFSLDYRGVLAAEKRAGAEPVFTRASHQMKTATGVVRALTRPPRFILVILDEAFVFPPFDVFGRIVSLTFFRGHFGGSGAGYRVCCV